ncbi:hypothetical protein THICB1_40045 [Thiomonas arsenitoxydans]|uniref:Uncharacterized protein n=1 Tax=Thiomonas arsenitoxydans (strain DSM 22701 / CIP 110005 / 3As) TaxID=426114 RepID=A0ABP1Z6X7_THIA3|nr:hypothetical protein ACO7_280006 [Thiomonas arsenitoxydans]CQR32348.1 hypothetical protein ACO3_300005 [Thiomonas arsenitoxydans]CQR34769.1 hypothetical protein THICB1_40045 [Thiomonas arsenitoxydans]CQR40938.1 hypothetical protein THICB6_90063 [Thiomonas arsenitoxydans]
MKPSLFLKSVAGAGRHDDFKDVARDLAQDAAPVGSNLRDGVCTTSRDTGRLQVTDKITDMPCFRPEKIKRPHSKSCKALIFLCILWLLDLGSNQGPTD